MNMKMVLMVFIIFLMFQTSYVFSNENIKVTFLIEKNTIMNDTRVFVKIQDYLLNKLMPIDTLSFKNDTMIQTFPIKRSNRIGFYYLYTENDEYISTIESFKKDSVVINLCRDTVGNFINKIIFQQNPYQTFFYKKINWLNDKNYYDIYHSSDIKRMFEYSDSMYKVNLINLENEFNNAKIDKESYNYFFNNIKYHHFHKLLRYLVENFYYKDKTDSLLDYYTSLLYNNDTVNVYNQYSENSPFSSYIFYIRMSIDHRYKNEWTTDNYRGWIISHIEKTKSLFKGLFKDKLLYDYVKELIKGASNVKQLQTLTEIINDFEKEKMDSRFISELRYLISDIEEIMPGTQVYDYEFTDVNGKQVKLSDFKGKYIYINLWALWCSSCYQYFDAEKELYSKFKDKDIYFLNIAIETIGYQKWSDFVKKKELSGIQLLYKGTLKNQLGKDFRLNGIPHYILLDKEGKIINPNAHFPHDEKLLLEFKKIGIE